MTISADATPISETVANQYLPTQLQQYVYLSRYAKWLESQGRRETWEETVARYVNFFKEKYPDTYPDRLIQDAILNLKTMPSMRALMTAGKALDRDNAAGYNCSFIAIDHQKAFDEVLYVLMCGTGVGFSVERQYIANLPEVADSFHKSDSTIVVADSKIGWASAYRELITLLYSGQIPNWDVSKVRPSGARLKTFGGRASGPKPLEDLFRFTIDTFVKAAGRKLTSVECHDLVCKVADIVVVGGVRRSALISLSNLSDDRMRVAKNGQWWESNPQRALANNSAAYAEKPEIELFMKEWLSLIESKSGERGIFNRVSARKKAAESGRRDTSYEFGTNPCFKAGTLIHTKTGTYPIESLIGREVEVWDGTQYVKINNFRVTGREQEVFTITLHDGSEITATPYHTFILENGERVQLKNLEIGQKLKVSTAPIADSGRDVAGAYIRGFMLGDGSTNESGPLLWLYEPKLMCMDRLIASASELPVEDVKATNLVKDLGFMDATTFGRRRMRGLIPRRTALLDWCGTYKNGLPADIYSWSVKSKAEFLAGFLDADGTAQDNKSGFKYQVTSISHQLLSDVQSLLKSIGIHSVLRLNKIGEDKTFSDGRTYKTQDLYRLNIAQQGAIALSQLCTFSRLQSFALREMKYIVKPQFNRIAAIEFEGIEDEVYCCTVPTNSSFALNSAVVTGNCGEILLRSCGFCNLTEVVLRAGDTLDEILAKIEVATIMGTYQSTLTNFRYLRPVWKKNAEEERLLGVSLTGIMDHEVLSKVSDEAKAWLVAMRDKAIAVNAEWAFKLGINQSVAITTVKPSGTVSQLVDSASGIHPRYAAYYARTVRADKKDPLAIMMRDVGFPVEDDFMKPQTGDVFYFPVKGPDRGVFRNDMTALEQLEHYMMFKESWCEHNPSITVYVRNHEWLEVGAWVYKHFDSIGGVSFLPHTEHSYTQPPYGEITEEEYQVLLAKMPKVDWSLLQTYEKTDTTTSSKELSCTAGVCEIL